jgi:hypothetical protein
MMHKLKIIFLSLFWTVIGGICIFVTLGISYVFTIMLTALSILGVVAFFAFSYFATTDQEAP